MTKQQQESTFPLYKLQNVFFCNGIVSLLGFNAVVGSLDYFAYILDGYNVYLYYPISSSVGLTLSGILFHQISKRFRYANIVKVGSFFLSLFLISLLFINYVQDDDLGFKLFMLAGFLIGFSNNLCQLSFYGMINFFGKKTVSRFTIGTATSGLSIIILRAIITVIFGDNNQSNIIPIAIYLSVAVFFTIVDLFLNLRMFKTPEYKSKIKNAISLLNPQGQATGPQQKIESASQFVAQKHPYIYLIWQSFKKTKPYPLIIFFNMAISYTLYPRMSIAKTTQVGKVWTSILMVMMFNIGDFWGKFTGYYRSSFNSRSIIFLFLTRLFFFFTIPMMVKQFTQEDKLLNNNIFPFFNQVIFAYTGGLIIHGSFILAFQKAPVKYKKYAGVLNCLLLQNGIMVGTLLAIPIQMLVQPDIL